MTEQLHQYPTQTRAAASDWIMITSPFKSLQLDLGSAHWAIVTEDDENGMQAIRQLSAFHVPYGEHIVGIFPSKVFTQLASLAVLDLRKSRQMTALPESIGVLVNLKKLDLVCCVFLLLSSHLFLLRIERQSIFLVFDAAEFFEMFIIISDEESQCYIYSITLSILITFSN